MVIKMNKMESEKIKEALWDTDGVGDGSTEQMCFPDAGMGRLPELLEKKRQRRRIGFGAFLKRQIRFVGWKIWLLQGMLLLILYGFFAAMEADFLTENIRFMAYFLCCLSVLVILSAVPVFYRCVRYAMYETELVSRFSTVKLLLAKVILIGIGDVVLLFILLWITVFHTNLRAESALLYILFPALMAVAGFLYLLGHIPAERLQIGSVGFGCILLCVFFLLKQFFPLFFEQSFSAGWAAACVLLLFVCGWQFYYLLHDSAYAQVRII